MLLETSNLSKTFNPDTPLEVRAVHDVTFTLAEGEILMLMGPSGSGKTTLLTMLGALLTPTVGTIVFHGEEMSRLRQHELTLFRRHHIGFIFQSFNLLDNLSALENVLIAGSAGEEMKAWATDLLDRLGLKSRMFAKPKALSGGERQRVAIARALANDPSLIIADEPTANLDRAIGHEVMTLLCSVACDLGKSVIIASHDERIQDVAHRIIHMEDGRLTKEVQGRHNEVCQMRDHHAA
ncbi:MAG: ABC transporter ATP-binding protein [Parcubacteria group bacterium]|nr:ABC transporter ATP-binding protein [Parcubacteria group bacterium]